MASLKEIIADAKKRGYGKEDLVDELIEKGYSKKEIDEAFGGRGGMRGMKEIGGVARESREVNYFDKIKLMFSNPRGFFQSVHESTIGQALILFVIVGVIVSVVNIMFSLFVSRYLFRGLFGIFGLSYVYGFIFLGASLVGTFIYAGISHLAVKGFHGSGNYVDSYNVVAYSLIPYLLISVVPFVGFLAIIYSIILMTFGFAEYHKITKGKAAFAALLPIIIFAALIVLFVIYLIFALRGLF